MDRWELTRNALKDWKWWGDAYMANVWLYLLATADPSTGKTEVSLRGLAKTLGLTLQQVREAIKRLEGTHLATHSTTQPTTHQGTTLTINETSSYKDEKSVNNTANNTPCNTAKKEKETKEDTSSLFPLDPYNSPTEERKVKEKKNTGEGLDFIDDGEMRKVMETWLAYKKEKKQSYAGTRSLTACYNKLLKLSGGSAKVAGEIVEQSMANNYSGLFPLKQGTASKQVTENMLDVNTRYDENFEGF